MNFKTIFKEYFTFSSGERNGILLLCFLILALFFTPHVYALLQKDEVSDFKEFENAVRVFDSVSQKSKIKSDRLLVDVGAPVDSNEGNWELHSVTDNHNPQAYKAYHPMLSKNKYSNNYQKKDPALCVELNTTDSATLLKIPGIGAWTASKIIRYREKLGGYFRKEQVLEIYHFSDTLYQKIEHAFKVDKSKIKKLDLNTITCDFKTRHPYIDFDLCKVIVTYRIQHRKFQTVYELRRAGLVDKEQYERLQPYLEANDVRPE